METNKDRLDPAEMSKQSHSHVPAVIVKLLRGKILS
jgi:hypothetical protein